MGSAKVLHVQDVPEELRPSRREGGALARVADVPHR